ncbi:toll-like receptor 4 [Biomphalaria glabrata]|uniref:Toll-like receptor 4 n=1 Tax=Biomphalaria glabrata TaxID=6526 RepID=A0A9W2YXA1_BIOGL|nr:toll-like receptor 4 [Biomphalaria glabrata]
MSSYLSIVLTLYLTLDYNLSQSQSKRFVDATLPVNQDNGKRYNSYNDATNREHQDTTQPSTGSHFNELLPTSSPDDNHFPMNNLSCSYSNHTVHCSGLSIYDIQPSWFPNVTETIFLNDNLITTLQNFTFSHVYNLTFLDLSDNNIEVIEIHAFEGLHSLKTLNFYNNKLTFGESQDFQQIFQPLTSLEELNIIQDYQYKVGMYSFRFLEQLPTLQNLALGYDLETLYFGEEFRKMSNLTILKLSGNVKFIIDASFANVAGLRELQLDTMPYLSNISHNAFSHLTHLKVLKMNWLQFSSQYAWSTFAPLQGRNMSEISFNTVSSFHTRSDPRIEGYITRDDTKYLLNICLETLELINCRIYYFTLEAFQNIETWDKCLMNLCMSYNSLQGSDAVLFRILKLKSLQTLTLENVLRPCFQFTNFPHSISGQNIQQDLSHECISNKFNQKVQHYVGENSAVGITPAFQVVRNHYRSSSLISRHEYITVSDSIKSINIMRFFYSQSMRDHYIFQGAHNVEYLDISDSGFVNFTGSLEGLVSLKTIILSGNTIKVLSKSYLDTLPALENLALANCQLDREFMSIHSGRLFQNLTRLQQLDLSSNLLNYLSTDTFMYNKHLKWLTLAQNQFREIPFSLKYTPELEVLDLSQNSLNTIDMASIHQLENIVSGSGHLKLLLSGNDLSCECNDLQFLQWMRSTAVTFDQDGNFTCTNKDGKTTYTLAYSDIESLWRECTGFIYFYIVLIVFCLYLIGCSIVFIMMKNKHFITVYILKRIFGIETHTRRDYPIDVYIAYSDTDYQFPCNELRQFIEQSLGMTTFLIDRDLNASFDLALGIVNAINKSWRVLLVCSESFLREGGWSMFTFSSAIYAQSPANPARIVALVHRDCLPLLPMELFGCINEDNILYVSEWAMTYEMNQMLTTRLNG